MKLNEIFNVKLHAYHYSRNKSLNVGDVISSNQTQATTYKIVWPLFKEVASELGLYFPEVFGYAYPNIKSNMSDMQCYKVEAPSNKITKGNFNYSLFVTMSALNSFTDRSIKNLSDRLSLRETNIKKQAEKYFTLIQDDQHVELISDEWTIVKVLL